MEDLGLSVEMVATYVFSRMRLNWVSNGYSATSYVNIRSQSRSRQRRLLSKCKSITDSPRYGDVASSIRAVDVINYNSDWPNITSTSEKAQIENRPAETRRVTNTRTCMRYRPTVNPRYLPSRFAIFRCSDSQILIPRISYSPQIPATATPHPTKFHTQS